MEIKKLVEQLNKITEEKFQPPKKPTEDDLDDLDVSRFALNRMEWLVDTQEEANVLIEAQKLIDKYFRRWKEEYPEFF